MLWASDTPQCSGSRGCDTLLSILRAGTWYSERQLELLELGSDMKKPDHLPHIQFPVAQLHFQCSMCPSKYPYTPKQNAQRKKGELPLQSMMAQVIGVKTMSLASLQLYSNFIVSPSSPAERDKDVVQPWPTCFDGWSRRCHHVTPVLSASSDSALELPPTKA